MAEYITRRIVEGMVSYSALFSSRVWKPYQKAVDALLKERGREDLIGG